MKVKNITLILLIVFSLGGCYIGEPTYEVFEKEKNHLIGGLWVPDKDGREIYSEDKYIYKYSKKGCHYGFLTNRDNKPEKVIGWIILSGKEHCKERQAWSLF